MTRTRHNATCRLTALLVAIVVGGALGVGGSLPWHRHLLAGLELFHSHSHLGGHHHDELHALAESFSQSASRHAGTPQSPGNSDDESDDNPSEPECALLSGSWTGLYEAPAHVTASSTVAHVADWPSSHAALAQDFFLPCGARAPPA